MIDFSKKINSINSIQMKDFKEFFFISIYLVIPLLLYVLPISYNVPLKIIFLSSNIIIVIGWILKKNIKHEWKPLFFSISLFLLSFIVVFYKGLHWSIPFYYLTGYISYIQVKKIRNIQSKLEYLIIISYIYFIVVYFSKLPSFIDRPGFDENVFYVSSSNTISIVLNIYLLTYVILGSYLERMNYRKILIFGTINIGLIFIQQSRIGLFAAIIILFLPMVSKFKKSYLKSFLPILLIVIFVFLFQNFINLENKLSLDSYLSDSRGVIQFDFFSNLSGDLFFWGYPLSYVYLGDLDRVYNMFLLNYNYTTIIGFILISIVFLYRIVFFSKYFFHYLFLVVIISYGMVEEIFLPMGWDFILYLLLFLKSNHQKNLKIHS